MMLAGLEHGLVQLLELRGCWAVGVSGLGLIRRDYQELGVEDFGAEELWPLDVSG